MIEEDLTLKVLIEIRDEIKGLRTEFSVLKGEFSAYREEVNKRFVLMEQRFSGIEKELVHIRKDIAVIVAHFDRDYLLLANKVEDVDRRLKVCEKKLI